MLRPTKGVLYTAGAIVLVFAGSWIAGEIRGCWKEKPPKEVPGFVDPGTPTPDPVNTAPTVTTCVPVAAPRLTREQLLAEAAEIGLRLVIPAGQGEQKPAKVTESVAGPTTDTPEEGDRASEDVLSVFQPMLFAKEHFGPGPGGDGITVRAWMLDEGGRIELFATWDPFQPKPAPEQGSVFGNSARFRKFLIVGGYCASRGEVAECEPGVGGGLSYEGWKYKTLSLDAHAAGMIGRTGDYVVLGGLGLGF